MRLAVIADIHGNAAALAAVLARIAAHRPDRILQLGDACNGPLDPAGTAALLRSIHADHVRGNGDRMVGVATEPVVTASARFARERLSAADRAWLAGWAAVIADDDWLACHGSPRSDTEYLVEMVTPTGAVARPPAGIATLLGPTAARLILCGHTHLPRAVRLPDGRLVVNPGSVGLPAYDDEQPFPHRMEAGSPHARYAVLERTAAGWEASLESVEYDWNGAAALAEANGSPGWARALRTGFV